MPRGIAVYNDFSGGLCTGVDPDKVAKNEVTFARDVVFTSDGNIKMMGESVSIARFAGASEIVIGAGQEIKFFSSDEPLSGGGGLNFVAVFGDVEASTEIGGYIYSVTDSFLATSLVSLGSNAASPECHFYFADGDLRITPFGVTAVNNIKWGYNKIDYFPNYTWQPSIPGSPAAIPDRDDYFQATHALAEPSYGFAAATLFQSSNSLTTFATKVFVNGVTGAEAISNTEIWGELSTGVYFVRGAKYLVSGRSHLAAIVSVSASSTDSTMLVITTESVTTTYGAGTNALQIFTDKGAGSVVKVTPDSGSQEGTIPIGNYDLGISYRYKYGQDGLIKTLPNSTTEIYAFAQSVSDSYVKLRAFLHVPYPPFVTGMRFWIRTTSTTDSTDRPWYYGGEVDFELGSRGAINAEFIQNVKRYNGYANKAGYTDDALFAADIAVYDLVDTYESINGFLPSDLISPAPQFKTAVVVNRTAYIGNVHYDGKDHPDTVLKSVPNKFDTFLRSRRLEVAIGDGENIIRMEAFAERILQFKENTLYIINVSREIDYLEATLPNMGVSAWARVCNSSMGVFWFNQTGVFLYNGERVVDLLLDPKDPSRRKISKTDWEAFYLKWATQIIGYDEISRKLFIWYTSSATAEAYVLDTQTMTWSIGRLKWNSSFMASTHSAFATDQLGRLNNVKTQSSGITFSRWNDSPVLSTTMKVRFRDENFGVPGVNKNIYKVNVNAKTGKNVYVKYAVNGITTVTNSFTNATLNTDATLNTTEFISSTNQSGVYRNIDSFSLMFTTTGLSPTVGAGFEIQNVSVIYRIKGLR